MNLIRGCVDGIASAEHRAFDSIEYIASNKEHFFKGLYYSIQELLDFILERNGVLICEKQFAKNFIKLCSRIGTSALSKAEKILIIDSYNSNQNKRFSIISDEDALKELKQKLYNTRKPFFKCTLFKDGKNPSSEVENFDICEFQDSIEFKDKWRSNLQKISYRTLFPCTKDYLQFQEFVSSAVLNSKCVYIFDNFFSKSFKAKGKPDSPQQYHEFYDFKWYIDGLITLLEVIENTCPYTNEVFFVTKENNFNSNKKCIKNVFDVLQELFTNIKLRVSFCKYPWKDRYFISDYTSKLHHGWALRQPDTFRHQFDKITFEKRFKQFSGYEIENCFSRPKEKLKDYIEFRKTFFSSEISVNINDPELKPPKHSLDFEKLANSKWQVHSSQILDFSHDVEQEIRNYITSELDNPSHF